MAVAEKEHSQGVLIVDDDAAIREVFSAMLDDRKTYVRTATNAAEARRVLQCEPIDLIICDQTMPGEDGLSLLADLKQSYPRLQRILVTGQISEDIITRGINEANLLRFLPKPMNPELFTQVVTDALRIAREEKSRSNRTDQSLLFSRRGHAAIMQITVSGMLAFFALSLTAVALMVLLYLAKWMLGIDLIPTLHAGDLL